jgi:hypothetical protein
MSYPSMMTRITYSGYRLPPEIIQQAIWLYVIVLAASGSKNIAEAKRIRQSRTKLGQA